VIETLATNGFDCGLRCLRNGECRSYNSQSDGNHGNMTCQLSDQKRQTRPDSIRQSPGFIYFGKGNQDPLSNNNKSRIIKTSQASKNRQTETDVRYERVTVLLFHPFHFIMVIKADTLAPLKH